MTLKMSQLSLLKSVHKSFSESIRQYILGEVLVGTLVYPSESNITPKTDIDLMIVAKKDKFKDILSSKYIKGLLDIGVVNEVLDKKIADYIVIKITERRILISMDLITPQFFEEMCNINLIKEVKNRVSYKFGNEPQTNAYPSVEFNGSIHKIQKISTQYNGGYSVELPLFFIFNNHGRLNYGYGIPTIKLATSKIEYDTDNFISKNIDVVIGNIVRRLVQEYPSLEDEKCVEYFFNILVNKNKFTEEYKKQLKEKILWRIKCIKKR